MARLIPKFKGHRQAYNAPRLTVQKHIPLYKRVGGMLIVTLVVAGASVWGYDRTMNHVRGDVDAALERSKDMVEELAQLRAERETLMSAVNASDSKLRMEIAAREALEKQLKSLEGDNAKLKADLAFFEGLLPADAGSGALSVPRLTAELDSAGTVLAVRAMVALGNGRSDREFSGRLQLSVITLNQGKTSTLQFPAEGMAQADWGLRFKRYHRLELNVPLPAGTQVRSVELRVLEGTAVRARQSVQL